MLPGFRILFATTVLAISILIFGLGAAALLRAAHEEFASMPSWRLAQQPMLAPQFELSGPTLAMLRVEALTAKPSPDRTIRQQAIIRDIPRDLPPAETVKQDAGDTLREAEQAPAEPAPAPETSAALSAKASTEAPAAEAPAADARPSDTPTSEASATEAKVPDVKPQEAAPAGVKASELRISEAKAVDAKSEPGLADPKPTEAISSETKSSVTEASEPRSTETVASLERSTEATASATIPRPAAKKVRRVNTLAIAHRRQIARARAEERARAEQLRQQQKAFPLFGG